VQIQWKAKKDVGNDKPFGLGYLLTVGQNGASAVTTGCGVESQKVAVNIDESHFLTL
jgi:hypothetical protein